VYIDRQSAAVTGNYQQRVQPLYIVPGEVLEVHILMHIAFAIPQKLAIKEYCISINIRCTFGQVIANGETPI
jgi:hypothetical protein